MDTCCDRSMPTFSSVARRRAEPTIFTMLGACMDAQRALLRAVLRGEMKGRRAGSAGEGRGEGGGRIFPPRRRTGCHEARRPLSWGLTARRARRGRASARRAGTRGALFDVREGSSCESWGGAHLGGVERAVLGAPGRTRTAPGRTRSGRERFSAFRLAPAGREADGASRDGAPRGVHLDGGRPSRGATARRRGRGRPPPRDRGVGNISGATSRSGAEEDFRELRSFRNCERTGERDGASRVRGDSVYEYATRA